MPWGPRTPDDIAARALLCARAALQYQPDIMVMACNTGSVHALDAMRAEFEPAIPVIGTVPAIKPAAAEHHTVAIWATVATTASAYQRRLIAEFGGSAEVTAVACPGLADAVDAGDQAATAAAVAASGRPDSGWLRSSRARLHRVRAGRRSDHSVGTRRRVVRVRHGGSRTGAAADSGGVDSRQPPALPRWQCPVARHRPRAAQRPAGSAAAGRSALPGRSAARAASRRDRR